MERTIRHRVNVSTSVKGVKTWDATVEVTATGDIITFKDDATIDRERNLILALSDRLTVELEKRYPPVTEK